MKYLPLLSIFSAVYSQEFSLVCHQPLHLARPGIQYVRDACCPAGDPEGLPFTQEIQGCCCDSVFRLERRECCMPDGGCDSGTDHTIPLGTECKRINCPLPPDVQEESQQFRCENGVEAGATCKFGCAEGFTLVDGNGVSDIIDVATCKADTFEWEVRIPGDLCCVPECPPLPEGTKLDFMIVLDKSSSIGNGNWRIVVEFIHTMIDMVPLNPDAVRMSVITYNNVVDTVFDFTDSMSLDKDQLKNIVNNIVYSGRGTHTYLGLENVYENDIKNNPLNRPDAEDMLLVITDGKSRGSSRITTAANLIKADGVEFYAVGVGADADPEEIEGMASEPASKYTRMVSVFEQLEAVAKSFLSIHCPIPSCD